LFTKENIPALLFKSGRFIAALTHGILTARLSPIALALAYLTTRATLYADRFKTKTPGRKIQPGVKEHSNIIS
jgi:hypothetical protein